MVIVYWYGYGWLRVVMLVIVGSGLLISGMCMWLVGSLGLVLFLVVIVSAGE